MLNDETVDEVRAVRESHAAQFGYDLRAIYEDQKKSEAEHIAVPSVYCPTICAICACTLSWEVSGKASRYNLSD